jgi:hypothetical protein
VSESESPRIPLRLTVVEVLASALAVRLVVEPSMPVALGLVALAGAWALEKIFVSHARVYQNSLIDARKAAEESARSAALLLSSASALEGRLTRLENREGFRSDGNGRR